MALIFNSLSQDMDILLYMFRQKNKMLQQEFKKKISQLRAKSDENLYLKEENLKLKSGREKLRENLEAYQKENKKLQDVARKKQKKRSDARKHRDVSSKNKRSGKPKGANGGGLKNPDPEDIDYTREHNLDVCSECNKSLKDINRFDHHDHYIRDFEKLKRGIRLVYIRHVIYLLNVPIAVRSFQNLSES